MRLPAPATTRENATLLAVSLVGILAFGLPFIVSALPGASRASSGRTVDASLLLALVLGGSLVIALGEVAKGPAAGSLSRAIALLGALVAIDATLRLIPSFLGASPVFALIVLVGYVFGPRFGFVMGALTLLLSAAITAGVGPWLPFQMLCAGWVGLIAGLLPHRGSNRVQLVTLALFGAAAGFGYGALMNLYSWPFAAPGAEVDAGLYWTPALSLTDAIARYITFYMTTSVLHDASRAVANMVLILLAGGPVFRQLQRYRTRATWSASDAGGDGPALAQLPPTRQARPGQST
jgi:energy-coupling factor transport system substrate-specific component